MIQSLRSAYGILPIASVLEECEKLCQKYENLFSRTIDTSDVSRINQANGQPVTVDQETADLIKTALHYGDLSDGKFDITIAPLSELWNFGHNDGQIPDPAAIEEARSHVNYKNVKVDGTTVQLLDPKAAIDLGAIAKGYIADQLKEYLESAGIKHGLISLGGNTVAIGEKPDGSPFKIGVSKNPLPSKMISLQVLISEINLWFLPEPTSAILKKTEKFTITF